MKSATDAEVAGGTLLDYLSPDEDSGSGSDAGPDGATGKSGKTRDKKKRKTRDAPPDSESTALDNEAGTGRIAAIAARLLAQSDTKDDEEVILSAAAKKAERKKQREREEKKIERAVKEQQVKHANKDHVKPSFETYEVERNLKRIATRGVVQLFNAVAKQQKALESEKKPKYSINTAVGEEKKAQFLKLLKGNTAGTPAQPGGNTWKVLKDHVESQGPSRRRGNGDSDSDSDDNEASDDDDDDERDVLERGGMVEDD